MKMAYISTIVSGVASLGVLIGLLSGIFLLVLSALRWVSRVRATLYEEELQSQKRLLVGNSCLVGNRPSSVKENGFKKPLPENSEGIIQSGGRPRMEEPAMDNTTEKEGTKITDTVQVREFIEKLVETIIGGPLDGITVGKLSSHSAYLGMFTKYHSLLCRELARLGFALHLSVVHKTDKNSIELDSSNSMQSSLQRLIKKIVSEAMCLPDIKDILCHSETTNETVNEDFENKSYEDILATAILNKVIENFQSRSAEKKAIQENVNHRYRKQKLKKGEDDDEIMSSSDWSDSSPTDKLSLTIEEYIEEVTTAFEVSDDEKEDYSDYETTTTRRVPFPESGRIVRDVGTDDENSDFEDKSSATELITSTSSWEENWLFQKKRLRSTPNVHHPVPVPMLVPNPSEDFRALVGGVDADDLSDISDCSDLILDDDSIPSTPIAPQRKTISLSNISSDVTKEEKQEATVIKALENETQTEVIGETEKERSLEEISEDIKTNSSSPASPEVLSQKDREFSVEDFDLSHQYESTNTQASSQGAQILLSSYESDSSVLRCRIAEREKEKWNNPVPIPDNPYSLENIEKREQRNKLDYFRPGTGVNDYIDFPSDLLQDELDGKNSESLRFTRDYYVNASKHPSGISSSSLNQLPTSKEQVSSNLHENFPSWNRKLTNKRWKTRTNLNHDSCDFLCGSVKYPTADERFKTSFFLLKEQTTTNQHFSRVFETTKSLDPSKTQTLGRLPKGFNSLKSRAKSKETISRRHSLDQEFSDFEKNSLRGDVYHSLLRARGASPNFIINPVFENETKETSEFPPMCEKCKSWGSTETDSEAELELMNSEPIVPCYRKTPITKNLFRISQESGYGSDSPEYSSDSLECWRLTPPKTPEVVESAFLPILKNKKNLQKTDSFSGF